jgi:hypothetical protein
VLGHPGRTLIAKPTPDAGKFGVGLGCAADRQHEWGHSAGDLGDETPNAGSRRTRPGSSCHTWSAPCSVGTSLSPTVAAFKTTIASCDDWGAGQPATRSGVNRLT